MNIQMANMITGEVVEWRQENPKWSNALGLKHIRGYIRMWAKAGLHSYDLKILKSSSSQLWNHLMDYMYDHQLMSCDICDKEQRAMDLDIVEDNEGVCMAIVCKGGCENHKCGL
jgi:hypothetical protein